MAHKVLTDARIWLGEFDLSGDMNALACEYVAEAKDDSCFGDTTQVNLGGNKSVALEAAGHIEEAAGGSGRVLFSKLGVNAVPLSFSPDGQAAGSTAYSFQALQATYNPEGEQGEIFSFTVSATGAGDGLVRGTIMVSPAAAITSTGTSTARQLGAVSATQKMYAALHVLSASASDTLDVKVQSDNASNFPSATDRITFTQVTDEGSEWKSVAGAITDDWWRISYTIAGSSTSFTFMVVLGIK